MPSDASKAAWIEALEAGSDEAPRSVKARTERV
jgi:hypothetical protein